LNSNIIYKETKFKEDVKSKIERQRKLTDEQIKYIRNSLYIGVRQMMLAKEFGVSQGLISRIKNNVGFYADI